MAIRYTLRIREPHTHYVEVEAEFPAGDLLLPVWTPGSYLIREYAKHIDGVAGARKTAKNRWHLAEAAVVRYRVYCHELTVRTNWVDDGFALIVPAATFLTHAGHLAEPHEVTVEHPYAQAWSGLASPGPNQFRARNYDELVDCPIYLGDPAVYGFTVEGRPHWLVNEGEGGTWDGPASAAAVQQIVEQYARLMGELPYERYVFLNLMVEAGGGLEHANSTVLMTSRWAWANGEAPKADPHEALKPSRHRWLDLVSHEFFHTWNVKRLRPVELGPFDYERENYTEGLWFAEGVTTYYGPLMVRRAGLMSDEALLADLSRTVSQVQTTPGRQVQSLAEASRDAWIKYYRPHENSPNVTVSYYTQGCLAAWVLDMRIRRATDNAQSLDDAVRLAQARFSGARGYTNEELFALLDEVAGREVEARSLVEAAGELDYRETLEWLGLRFAAAGEAKPWIGVQLKAGSVEAVVEGSPAYESRLAVGDELIAVGGYRVTGENLDRVLAACAGQTRVVYSRRGRMQESPIRVVGEPRRVWTIESDPEATPAQRRNLARWLQSC